MSSSKKSTTKQHPRVQWIDPMKASLALEPPKVGEWIYEIKWDGYRVIAIKNGDEVELFSRNNKSLTAEFPEIRDDLRKLPVETAIFDGEICALDEQGRPRFQLLQARAMGRERPPMRYFIFDLLHRDGHDLCSKKLVERRRQLLEIIEHAPALIALSGEITADIGQFLVKIREFGMEGVIGKRADSKYQPGVRGRDWIKLKVVQEEEFVIGGFTPPEGTRTHFGALIVGYYRNGKLYCAGKAGTGFNQALLASLHKQLKAIEIDECPFVNLPQKSASRWSHGITRAEMRKCTWVKPKLVCQVKFSDWTEDEHLRFPVFLGLRKDKAATEVVREPDHETMGQ